MWVNLEDIILSELSQTQKDKCCMFSLICVVENIYFCFFNYAKAFDCVEHSKLWKILEKMGIPDHLTCMQVKKQQLEPDMEQQTYSKLGKEYIKAVYHHLAYLTYMQSTSCEMLGWMKHSWNQECQEKYQ